MLKADFHTHSKGDPEDFWLKYPPQALIDRAANNGYDVLAITWHNGYAYDKTLAEYAKKRNILLIPGMEKTIETKHVLLINFTKEECENIHTFQELKKTKKPHHLVIAPHPFLPFKPAVNDKFYQYAELFDALEWTQFFGNYFPYNKKAARVAKEYQKTLIGNSDSHALWQLNKSYTLIESKKTIPDIINAVKSGKAEQINTKLHLHEFIRQILSLANGYLHHFLRHKAKKI